MFWNRRFGSSRVRCLVDSSFSWHASWSSWRLTNGVRNQLDSGRTFGLFSVWDGSVGVGFPGDVGLYIVEYRQHLKPAVWSSQEFWSLSIGLACVGRVSLGPVVLWSDATDVDVDVDGSGDDSSSRRRRRRSHRRSHRRSSRSSSNSSYSSYGGWVASLAHVCPSFLYCTQRVRECVCVCVCVCAECRESVSKKEVGRLVGGDGGCDR